MSNLSRKCNDSYIKRLLTKLPFINVNKFAETTFILSASDFGLSISEKRTYRIKIMIKKLLFSEKT